MAKKKTKYGESSDIVYDIIYQSICLYNRAALTFLETHRLNATGDVGVTMKFLRCSVGVEFG